MAAAKKQTGKRRTAGSSARGKKSSGRQVENNGFGTEILLLVLLAVSVLMILGNLGLAGSAGEVVSSVLFGIMGLMAYVFPIALFLGAVFVISNRTNPLAWKKTAAAALFFVTLCGVLHLLTEGYMKSTTLADYYALCSGYRTGGGVIGGALCISTISAFGVAGGYVIMILVLMISLILITQRSFFGFLFKLWDGFCSLLRGSRERYLEGQPERDLKKELRQRERRQRRETRQAERLKELEEALAAEEEDEESSPASGPGVSRTARSLNVKKNGRSKRTETTEPVETAESGKQEAGFRVPSFLAGIRNSFPPESSLSDEEDGEGIYPANPPEESRAGQPVFHIQRSEPVNYGLPEEEPSGGTKISAAENMSGEVFPDGKSGREPASDALETEGLPSAETEEESPERPAARESVRKPKSSQKEIEGGIQNIRKEISAQKADRKEYHYPPLKLLKRGSGKSQGDSDAHLRKTAQKLQDTLHNFGVNVTVTNVSCGPTVTRYELSPEQGVKVSRIVSLADDIKLNLATPDIRIEAPIPGKAAVGIEVPNKENQTVMLRDLLQAQEFQTAKSKLSFAVGKDIGGKPVVADIAKMPHLLIAGATGSGKSVCINTLIVSILYKASPEEVKLIMIDPKVVELSVYNGIPHLLIPVVTDPKKAAGALNWAVSEMMSRYNTFAEYNVRNLEEYNRKAEGMRIPEGEEPPEKMPQIVIVVDELADLMMVAPGEVEDSICRLAQLARAAGIHLIIATQRPSVNVITGLIKANMPSRIAFSVSSGVDSRTILDMNGAEKLLGKGDMLFYPQGYQKPARLQGAFVSDEEVSGIVDYLSNKNPVVKYNPQIEQQVNTGALSGGGSGGDERDTYFAEAGKFIIEKEKASIGMLQRVFKIGFNRAARIMDQLCDAGVVGPEEGTKPRKVLMTLEEFEKYIEEVV